MDEINENNLPNDIIEQLRGLEVELHEGDITEKGYCKKRNNLLQKYKRKNNSHSNNAAPVEHSTPAPSVQHHTPAENTDLEPRLYGSPAVTASGDTSSGFLAPQSGRRRDGRKYTRDESRYRSDIREEAVREALARNHGQEALVPCKRKERSEMEPGEMDNNGHGGGRPVSVGGGMSNLGNIPGNSVITSSNNFRAVQEQDSDTEDDDDDNVTNASSDSSNRHRNSRHSDQLPSASSLTQISAATSHKSPRVSRKDAAAAIAAAAASSHINSNNNVAPRPQVRTRMGLNPQQSTESSRSSRYQPGAHGAPPDVTQQVLASMQPDTVKVGSGPGAMTGQQMASSVSRPQCEESSQCGSVTSLHQQQSQPPTASITSPLAAASTTAASTTTASSSQSSLLMLPSATENGLVSSRVSHKIQQLVQTLKRPKRRPLPEYFQEDEDAVPEPCLDPSAPKPKGTLIEPAAGEPVNMLSGLPRSLELALEGYAQAHPKQPAMTCIDNTGRHNSSVLTYAKLQQKATRIAYLLLNKVGHRGEQSLKPRDRVALVFANNDPANLMCAFYGCLLASVVPLAIEVPLARRDAGCQSMGFLLSQQDVRVVLTSEPCYKSLPRAASGEIDSLVGWPRVQWINVDHHTAAVARDWRLPERLTDTETLYIEYSYSPRDASVRGVCVSRQAAMEHCRTLASVCRYEEGETLVCVSELKRETGLWHGLLTSVLMGLHVVFVPYAVLKADPAVWLKQVVRHRAVAAVVKSRDMHWALLADKDGGAISTASGSQGMLPLACLRALLVADGSNPWSLSTCDNFLLAFRQRGLRPDALCPCAGSSESLTISLRRPGPPPSQLMIRPETAPSAAALDLLVSADPAAAQPPTSAATASSTGGRGVLSMHSLSYGLVRVDSENSMTSLTLQDCGQLLPGARAVVIKPNGSATLCHTDEVGEVCIQAPYTGCGYNGLSGQTNAYFKVQPLDLAGNLIEPDGPGYVRTGMLGFLGPATSGGLLFICGSLQGLMTVSGRRHNADDIIATVLAVEPTKLVFRGRIAVFSVRLLRDERIVVVAELRLGYNEEAAFKWMSRVLQAVDSIHQSALYSIALVPQNRLAKTPLGGIHVAETRRRFLEGRLGACNVLLCPHGAVTNLPQPRQQPAMRAGPSAMMVGHLVQGARLAQAQGRRHNQSPVSSELPLLQQQQQQTISALLLERANGSPNTRLFVQLDARLQEASSLTALQLQRRAERIASLLVDKKKLPARTPVLLAYPPGLDLVCAMYACLLCGCVPIPVRPPCLPCGTSGPVSGSAGSSGTSGSSGGPSYSSSSTSTISSTAPHLLIPSPTTVVESILASLDFMRQVMQTTGASTVLTCGSVLKVLRSREVGAKLAGAGVQLPPPEWQLVIDTDDLPKKRLPADDFYRPTSLEETAYYDFCVSPVSTTSGINSATSGSSSSNGRRSAVGVAQTHAALLSICQAQKLQCEFYPSREVVLSLDPYSGLGLTLWCLAGVYCGHLSYLVPPQLLDTQPDLWLSACSAKQVRDTFCSYNTVETSTRCLANSIPTLKQRGIQLNCLRSLVIVAEERPRVQTTGNFCKLFSVLGLNPRAVSTSFGCRVNVAMCLQGPSSPETSSVYVDQLSLRNDRVKLVEKGSPHSVCLLDSGKLLPGVRITIANPDTQGQCADSHLGEIWVSSRFNSARILLGQPGPHQQQQASTPTTDDRPGDDLLSQRLACGDTDAVYARTGYLGFVRRTELTQSDGERHDALFVVGALEDTILLRGMRYHPIDIETTVIRSHKSKIAECVVFTWSNLLVVVVELNGEEWEAVDLVHLVTAAVLEEHHLIVGVVVVVDRGTVHINARGEKERLLLRELFVNDKLDPMYVSYNM